jgi:eukaryotic-like serine/threonine-protein kinase
MAPDRDTLSGMPGPPPTPATRPAQDGLIGRTLDGKVRLERLLGKGGTGRVYGGTQVSLGRRVAVKVMRPDLDAEDERSFEDRFFREASLAGQLQHPNIVTVHDYGRTADGVCYIVMELLGGSDLKALMKQGPIPPARTLVIFEQIVRGLRVAHRAGLVHRDVKPGNIRLTEGEDGRDFVKVLDFGLVKGSEDTEITQDGTFLGTPHYAAPEQVRGDEADGRSDLYAVGVMLYRALCGKLPYWSKNPMAIAMAHVREPYPPMSSRAPGVVVDPGLEAIARRCMHKDRERRYGDAGALLADVVAARRLMVPDLETAEIELPDDVSLPPVASPERRRRWPLALALGLGLAGALGGGAILQGQDRGAELVVAPPPPESEAAAAVLAAPDPAPPALHEVYVVLSSVPSGAEVALDGAVLGTTPYAELHTFDLEAGGTTRDFLVRLSGHEETRLTLDVGGEKVVENVDLKRRKRRAPTTAAVPATREARPSAASVRVDDVTLSGAEAAAALRFVNSADEPALRAAGVAGRQVNIILDKRPFSDLVAFGATPFIGRKTVEAVAAATR